VGVAGEGEVDLIRWHVMEGRGIVEHQQPQVAVQAWMSGEERRQVLRLIAPVVVGAQDLYRADGCLDAGLGVDQERYANGLQSALHFVGSLVIVVAEDREAAPAQRLER